MHPHSGVNCRQGDTRDVCWLGVAGPRPDGPPHRYCFEGSIPNWVKNQIHNHYQVTADYSDLTIRFDAKCDTGSVPTDVRWVLTANATGDGRSSISMR